MTNKIGIITELSLKTVNYGNQLQAFALNKYLSKNYNYDVETILLKDSEVNWKYLSFKKFLNQQLIKMKKKVYPMINHISYTEKRYKAFENFAKENIKITSFQMTINDIKKADYDILIVGSDVVWFQKKDCINKVKFIALKQKKLKKFSYAASFGTATIPSQNRKYIAEFLRDFNAISVREKSAMNILNKIGIGTCELVCDPTLLLSKSEWEKIARKPVNIEQNVKEEYAFAYILGNEQSLQDVKEYFKTCNLKLFYIPYTNGVVSDGDEGDNPLMDCSPQEWIWMIQHAKYVITDSFHGLMFSIIFKKKFLVIERMFNVNLNARLVDFLEYIEASEKLVNVQELNIGDGQEWQYEKYEKNLDKLISKSKKYIEEKIVGGF